MQSEIPNLLYKYLSKDFAKNMVNKGEIYIGTLLYYRHIEDITRVDSNEGKKSTVNTFPEGDVITSKEEFDNRLAFLKDTNTSYQSGTIKIDPGTKFIVNDDITDTYIYCTSKKCSQSLKKKFNASSCVEIYDVQNFLNAISRKLFNLGLIYEGLGSGRNIDYDGHEVTGKSISGNWLKDTSYNDEEEFRFSFVPIMKKNGLVIQPAMSKNGDASFPRDADPLDIQGRVIKCKEIIDCCRLLK